MKFDSAFKEIRTKGGAMHSGNSTTKKLFIATGRLLCSTWVHVGPETWHYSWSHPTEYSVTLEDLLSVSWRLDTQ